MPQFDLVRLQLAANHLQTLQTLLAQHVPQAQVWAYGSRVTGGAHEGSDLDLVLRNPVDLTQPVKGWFSLKEALQESPLPMLVEVHLWASLPAAFHRNIEAGYVVVWEGDRSSGGVSEWPIGRFGNLVRFVADKSQAKDASINTYISTENMLGNFGGIASAAAVPRAGSVTVFKAGDTLFSNIRTYFKKVWQAQFDGYCSNDVLVLRTADTGLLLPDYLHNLTRWQQFTELSVRTSKGAKMPRGDKDAMADFKFQLPPVQEQRAIAHILGTLDDKIQLNRRMNETLEATARALFQAWFVDFEPVRAKMDGRWLPGQSLPGLPAHFYDLFPDRLVESELGEIPEGWEVPALGEVCSYLTRGISPKYIELGGVSVLNQKCIRDFSIDFSKSRRHDVEQKRIDGRALELGDVLVNSTGVGTLGRVAQVRRLSETTIVDSHVTVVRSGNRINPMYLGGLMSMKQSEIENMGEGSTGQTELSRSKLSELKILLPRKVVLDHFSKHTEKLSERIAENQVDSEIVAQLRDTLLPQLISGELRVQDAEGFLKERGL